MGIEILITVAVFSGGTVAAVYKMLSHLERILDNRCDQISGQVIENRGMLNLMDHRLTGLETINRHERSQLSEILNKFSSIPFCSLPSPTIHPEK
jgi:hypothetical protein